MPKMDSASQNATTRPTVSLWAVGLATASGNMVATPKRSLAEFAGIRQLRLCRTRATVGEFPKNRKLRPGNTRILANSATAVKLRQRVSTQAVALSRCRRIRENSEVGGLGPAS